MPQQAALTLIKMPHGADKNTSDDKASVCLLIHAGKQLQHLCMGRHADTVYNTLTQTV